VIWLHLPPTTAEYFEQIILLLQPPTNVESIDDSEIELYFPLNTDDLHELFTELDSPPNITDCEEVPTKFFSPTTIAELQQLRTRFVSPPMIEDLAVVHNRFVSPPIIDENEELSIIAQLVICKFIQVELNLKDGDEVTPVLVPNTISSVGSANDVPHIVDDSRYLTYPSTSRTSIISAVLQSDAVAILSFETKTTSSSLLNVKPHPPKITDLLLISSLLH
jgi:hypothetical protein